MTGRAPTFPRFTEDEIFLAIRGAQRAGANMAIEISPDGTIRLLPMAVPQIGDAAIAKGGEECAPPLRDILKIDDVAKHWNVSSGAVRSAIAVGKIGHFRIGTLIRIKREEVERIDSEGGIARRSERDPAIPYVPKPLPGKRDAYELGRRSRNPKPKSK